jgi:hypothetical protein
MDYKTMKMDYQKTILTQFGLICFSGFRKEDLNVKVYDEQQITDRRQVKANTHMAFGRVGSKS